MRLVMMGTGGFAVPTFEAMLGSAHEVVALVTRPQRRGRGGRPPKNPMRESGERAGLPLHDPDSINEDLAIELVAQMNADLMVVCDYGQILSKKALGTTRLGGINLHASLLPEYRGAAPINWAIYDGKKETGVSVIHMTPKLDGGPVIVQEKICIEPEENAIDVEHRLADVGAIAVMQSIDLLANWDGASEIGELQSSKRVTKAPRLKKEDGLIDWNRTAQQISDQVRAFQPWPRTYTFFTHGKKQLRLIVDKVRVEPTVAEAVPGTESLPGTEPLPGSIVESSDQEFVVATSEGRLHLELVQPEGKKQLSGSDFLRGYQVQPGSRLGITASV